MKEKNACDEYLTFMNEQLGDSLPNFSASHPLFYVSQKDYSRWKDNTILLKSPLVTQSNKIDRIIAYQILSIGKNLKLAKSDDGTTCINLKTTKYNCFL